MKKGESETVKSLHSGTITILRWICSQSLNGMHLNTALYVIMLPAYGVW